MSDCAVYYTPNVQYYTFGHITHKSCVLFHEGQRKLNSINTFLQRHERKFSAYVLSIDLPKQGLID